MAESLEKIAGLFVLLTGLAVLVLAISKPGALSRAQETGPGAFRFFQYFTYALTAGSAVLHLLDFELPAGSVLFVSTIFMAAWWPFLWIASTKRPETSTRKSPFGRDASSTM